MSVKGGRIGLSTALVRAAFLVNGAYAENSREFGISSQQGQLLCCLRAQPFGMGDLSVVLGLAKSTVTGLVNNLERDGLVRREADFHDSRAVSVALTEHGREVADGFYTRTKRQIEQFPASLTPAELETLTGLLARVAQDNNVSAIFMEIDPADA
ncbi:MarR family winged helix-turn-helix transcriptional regulator [Symbioplanes lichenis]|uniref:MarR family winged helix-turn-helix transcriptional regulator n=1 Tax=Symbioplanes lichenis TaxID=1629072 RepID=UPI002739AD4C|nr:MarR family transcriptional regulator [Actinoplanes lichenis]